MMRTGVRSQCEDSRHPEKKNVEVQKAYKSCVVGPFRGVCVCVYVHVVSVLASVVCVYTFPGYGPREAVKAARQLSLTNQTPPAGP